MKKAIIPGLVVVLLAACDDTAEPPDELVGQTFEVDNVFFDYDSELNFWSTGIGFPSDVVVFESDAVLAYRFVESVSDGSGGTADVWEMLPNVIFLGEDDAIQYVFNHTFFDAQLIIDGNRDLRDLGSGFTDNQSFRFVVAPAAFVAQTGVDVSDYEAVVEALQIVVDPEQ